MLYNWHRDYNPALGRYTESDPIGLGGGINTYTYVSGSPLALVDSAGLLGNASGASQGTYVPKTPSPGVALAKQYICKYGGFAWSQARHDRNTSDDQALRDAEHYLYAYESVKNGDQSFGVMLLLSVGYSAGKGAINLLPGVNLSPASINEVIAGAQGAFDGANSNGADSGGGADCGCQH